VLLGTIMVGENYNHSDVVRILQHPQQNQEIIVFIFTDSKTQ